MTITPSRDIWQIKKLTDQSSFKRSLFQRMLRVF